MLGSTGMLWHRCLSLTAVHAGITCMRLRATNDHRSAGDAIWRSDVLLCNGMGNIMHVCSSLQHVGKRRSCCLPILVLGWQLGAGDVSRPATLFHQTQGTDTTQPRCTEIIVPR